MWRETSLLCDSAVHLMNSNTCVFADSVLCLGSLSDYLVKAWKDKIKWYLDRKCKNTAKMFGHFWDLVARINGTEPHVNKPDGEWDRTAESMMLNFAESGHPVFLATRASGRGELLKQRERKEVHSLHGSEETVELNFRTVISVNQLSIYGAVADVCNELAPDSRKTSRR